MEKILLIGGGGHSHSVIDVIEQENKYQIAGIIDKKELIGKEILGYKVIGSDDDLRNLFKKYKYAFITVGQINSVDIRIEIFNNLTSIGFKLPTIISPLSYVSKHSKLGEGTIVMHHALVNSAVDIGKNCIINTKALIEHDSIIEDHCHIATASVINGGVVVKEKTFFGSNATSKEYIEIQGFIKAGKLIK